ncbi:hypothetical protein ABZ260_25350, partial [Streptosporangium sp. NPDC006013]|uniref:hypothetical protein n=1 Tax=Streptosporangium sp. NPDC006013 TaxID=3155596 RepID=UPI0033B507C9
MAVLVQDEHDRVGWSARSLPSRSRVGVTPSRPGAGLLDLPSPRLNTRYRREAVSVSRFVPTLGRVCSHGFQSGRLRKHPPVA